MERVLITGAGVYSPIGCSLHEFMENLHKKKYGINHIENFDTCFFPVDIAAEVKSRGKIIKSGLDTDRKSLFIKRALKELLESSPDFENYLPEQRMIQMGSGMDYFNLKGYIDSPDSKKGLWKNFYHHSHHVLKELAKKYNIKGGYNSNVAACVASTQAMGLSFRILKHSGPMTIITGGYDSMLCHLDYIGFYKLGALSDVQDEAKFSCKPFDKNRRGLVLGEGGVAFLMQRERELKQNQVMAEICGYGSTMDAYKVTDPHPQGEFLAKAALEAISEASITPDDINCVHLHGTGTYKNAIAETGAMKIIFGQAFQEVPVFSLKAQIGHLIGACGAMEMLAVIYSLQNQLVPPTLNYLNPDSEVPLNVIKDHPLPKKINYMLKLNSGFGGQNAALVVKKYER